MIINTEKIKFRPLAVGSGNYIAIYGTQENPFSSNYDLMDLNEAFEMAKKLEEISLALLESAEMIRENLEKKHHDLPPPNAPQAAEARREKSK